MQVRRDRGEEQTAAPNWGLRRLDIVVRIHLREAVYWGKQAESAILAGGRRTWAGREARGVAGGRRAWPGREARAGPGREGGAGEGCAAAAPRRAGPGREARAWEEGGSASPAVGGGAAR
ncbi:hypothetical protein PVAP13_7NG132498 [Panicum virgatum]|uniref:Uncharacterized protein n=1 Tax=Panicum virgatum TaxID=38727 RepID=A0A8T0PTQ0_PANVG|nr:hypothetical protein PVAP13_7NG132498 [Panicum virgatum]